MKTTIDIPEPLLRRTKAAAALRGQSMKEFVQEALEQQVRRDKSKAGTTGWRAVFGQAPKGARREVDRVVQRDLSRVDPKDWR